MLFASSNDSLVTIGSSTIDCLINILNQDNESLTDEINDLQLEESYLPLVALAHQFWLVGALVHQLKAKGVWQQLPQQLTDYLQTISLAYHQRGEAIKADIEALCSACVEGGVKVLLLKGAASLFNGSYSSAELRYMADIDVLVPVEQQEVALTQLKALGYQPNEEESDLLPVDHHHLAPLIKDEGICYVELHRALLNRSYQALLTVEEAWQHSIAIEINPTLTVLQLSASHQLILAIGHSELADKHFEKNSLELRQLHSIYMLIRRFEATIDWQMVKEHFHRVNQLSALHNALYRVYQLFNLQTPITITNDADYQQRLMNSRLSFLKKQGNANSFDTLKEIVLGYKAETILSLYGNESMFPVFRGRLLHAKRHVKLVCKWLFTVFNKG